MKQEPKKSGEPRIKWVNAAKTWCLTYFKDGKQIQEWIDNKEKAEKRLKEIK